MKKNKERGYVYLIGDWGQDGVYKIGVTRGTIENRIKRLQTGNANEIYICSYYQTNHPFFIEKTLHQRYGSKKLSGEWFQLSYEEFINFKKTCSEIEDMIDAMKDNPFFPKNPK